MRIGLIGVGLMGRGMGLRLLRDGHVLRVLAHVNRETVDELVAAGAVESATAAEIAADSDAIVLCLPNAVVVEEVLFGPTGIAGGAARGLLVLDCSTSVPVRSREFSRRLDTLGIAFVDAPVTGGPTEAATGKLVGLVGGSDSDIERARAILDAFCATIHVFGAVGTGHAAKLVNNGMGFGILAVVAEVLATAIRQGLHLPTLLEMIDHSGGQNRILQGLTPWLLTGDESFPKVTIATAAKDIDYFVQVAQSVDTDGPVLAQVHNEFRRAIESGIGDRMLPAYAAAVVARESTNFDQEKELP